LLSYLSFCVPSRGEQGNLGLFSSSKLFPIHFHVVVEEVEDELPGQQQHQFGNELERQRIISKNPEP